MMAFHRASSERVNVFEVDESYVFKHYFDGDDVFARLRPYYNFHQYRFEVPPEEFDELREFLDDEGYGLVVVDAVEEFVVAVKQYRSHPDKIFKRSVMQRSADGYNFFLLTDAEAVDRALDDGARQVDDVPAESPFSTAPGQGDYS